MMPADICPICLQRKRLTKHHIWRRAVFGRTPKNNETEYICNECHQTLEAEITKKENEVLKQYPEIYAGTLNEYLAIGREGILLKRKKLHLKRTKGGNNN